MLFLLLVRGETAADVQALVVGQDHPSYREELVHYLTQELSALPSHIIIHQHPLVDK